MDKDFDKWNIQKKDLEDKENNVLYKTGDIWWCSVGLNVAEESCGKGDTYRRPVLILRKLSKNSFIGLPLSTKVKIGTDRKSTRLNSSHPRLSRMPSSA